MLKWDDVTRMAARLNGVPVLGCRPGSPAARAGVRYGDILMAVNGDPTPDWGSYVEARAKQRGTMRVDVFRAGETLTFELALPAPGEPIDPLALLEELLEAGTMPLAMGDPRRDPKPS
jgi:S1-C subfamily serine protease